MQLTKVKRVRAKQKQKPLAALLDKNPVLVLGLDLPFLIATSFSLRAAAAISLELLFIHMGTVIVALIISRFVANWLRPLVLVAVSTLIMVYARILIAELFRGTTDNLGMYMYLMAVNGMTIAQCYTINKSSRIYPVLSAAATNVLGFTVAMFAVSLLREYFGSGTLWGFAVPAPFRLPGITAPFFGFILVGFLAAGTRFLNRRMLGCSLRAWERQEKRFSVVQEL